jgi:saccharopine dehydrogenase-like NADP-dependent oxidoreductase
MLSSICRNYYGIPSIRPFISPVDTGEWRCEPLPEEQKMKNVAVMGAGKIGATIAKLLARTGDYHVTLVDRQESQLAAVKPMAGVTTAVLEIEKTVELDALLAGQFAVLSALPYHLTTRVAESAARAGCHYLDLTEDVASTRVAKALGAGARTAFIPQCGLAPGFISIVTHDLASRFDSLDAVKMRVGALPRFPSNTLGYNLTWSTDGMINEYCEPCEAIVDGKLTNVMPLEEREELALDGVTYEAFNTSGGLGTLCETLAGKVRTLNYRTLRYPGHVAIMKTLLSDLGLRHKRHILKEILENAVPGTMQDVIIIFVTVSGIKGGRLMQETYANQIFGTEVDGEEMSAIQLTTASGIAAVLDMLADGTLPEAGFVRQEDIPLASFLANRFGAAYAEAARQRAAA